MNKLNINIKLPTYNTKNSIKAENLAKYFIGNNLIERLVSVEGLGEKIFSEINFVREILIKNPNNLTNEEKYIYKQLENINELSINVFEEIFDDIFEEISGKKIKKQEIMEFILRGENDFPFLKENILGKNDFYERILIDIYFLIVSYIISKKRWIFKIKELSDNLNNPYKKDIYNIASIFDDNIVFPILNIITINLYENSKEQLIKDILSHNLKVREKKINSAIKKILKDKNYASQFVKNGVLADQAGIKIILNDLHDLEIIGGEFKDLKEKKIAGIDKFNPRGIFEENDHNKESIKETIPFINVGMNFNGTSLCEIALRVDENNEIKKIIERNDIGNYEKTLILVEKIDDLNHEIYKLSQDIKIIRIISDCEKNLYSNRKTHAEKTYEKFLNKKIKIIVGNVRNQLIKKLPENFITPNNIELELIVYKILEKNLERVINSLTFKNLEKLSNSESDIKYYKRLEKCPKLLNKSKSKKAKIFIQERKKIEDESIFLMLVKRKIEALENVKSKNKKNELTNVLNGKG